MAAAVLVEPADWPPDRDVAGIAAERSDISLHPAERLLLVHQSVVAEVMFFAVDRRMAEIAEEAETVVDGHNDRWAGRTAFDESAGVVVVALTVEQAAAVDPEQDWKLLRRVGPRGEDVQVETVLRYADRTCEHTELGDLRARVAKLRCVQRLRPGSVRLWWLPAEIADGRSGVRDA